MRRTAFRFRRRILFAAAATLLAWGALELVLRLTGVADLPAQRLFTDPYDSNYAMVPRAVNPWVDVEEYLNAGGFRGRDVGPRRTPGTYRILSLGDSTTFGTQVRNEQTYTYLAGEKLGARGLPVETINAGMPGSTVWKQVIIFEKHFKDFDLDLVILYANYGLRRDMLELRRFMEDNRVRLKIRDGLARSHLYRWLRLWLRPPDFTAHLSQHPQLDQRRFVNNDHDLEISGAVERYMEQDLIRLRDGCRAAAAKLLVVPLLSRLEFKELRDNGLQPGTAAFASYVRTAIPSQQIRPLAAKLGIETVSAVDAFLIAYQQHEMFLDDCHFTAPGHVAMADLLAETICEKNLLPTPCRPAAAK